MNLLGHNPGLINYWKFDLKYPKKFRFFKEINFYKDMVIFLLENFRRLNYFLFYFYEILVNYKVNHIFISVYK